MRLGGAVAAHPARSPLTAGRATVVGMTACHALAAAADSLAGAGLDARRFLVALGRVGAGVRTGPLWFVDAARGGRNLIPGRGFRREFDDSTSGQARHFAGVVATATRLGIPLTRRLSVVVLRDPLDSSDGRLTESALEFVALIRDGRMPQADAAGWITSHVCAAGRQA